MALGAYRRAFRAAFGEGRRAVYWEPNHLAIPNVGPTVTTVHDLSVLEHPEWHPADRVARWQAELPASLAATDRWIVPSEFTRRRMSMVLGVAAEQITVIPLAGRALPYPRGKDIERFGRALGLPERYFLHVGTIEPRKNLLTLLDAYQAMPGRDRVALVLAGPLGWGGRKFRSSLRSHPAAATVLAAGYVSDAALAGLLAGATALVAPSHYEGFGLPLLEAMACGVPVLSSTAEGLAEVAGRAAELVGAADPAPWTAAMQRIAEDRAHRDRLAEAGRRRAGTFSWSQTARLHVEAMAAESPLTNASLPGDRGQV